MMENGYDTISSLSVKGFALLSGVIVGWLCGALLPWYFGVGALVLACIAGVLAIWAQSRGTLPRNRRIDNGKN